MSKSGVEEYQYILNLQFQEKHTHNTHEIDEEDTDSESLIESELQKRKDINNPERSSEEYNLKHPSFNVQENDTLKDYEFNFKGATELEDKELVYDSNSFDSNGSDNEILIKEVSSAVEDGRILGDIREDQLKRTKPSRKRNMSFSKQESRRIEYENELLLRRIMAQQKPKNKFQGRNQTCASTAEINRRKLQRKIEYDNVLLLQKIRRAKPCVITKGNQSGFRTTIL